MVKFADEAVLEVSSGNGGNGCIAFRREKFAPMGGPAGGDGGRGGDVIFEVKNNLRTLVHLRFRHVFRAKNGADGEGRNKFGKDGEDVIIPIPAGTILKDFETGSVIRDFTGENEKERFVFLTGGKGGWGNTHFKSSTNQAPRYAHDGTAGETRKIKIELNIMADIGLVGFPNAGKSSLLDFFTNARPKIAPYPFTTKIPNLGVLHVDQDHDIIIADIPGIIEGAAEGAGLGIRFLKHIMRTSGLAFIIDSAEPDYLDAFDKLLHELEIFSKPLAQKPKIILCNKLDIQDSEEHFEEIKAKYKEYTVLGMSIHARTGMGQVQKALIELATAANEHNALSAEQKAPLKSTFLSTRSVCE